MRPEPFPLVTIVTPSFNQAEFIAETIESVLTQDYPAIEYIVVDGGSTDGTLEILGGYGDRMRWTSRPDRGQSDAIHRGLMAGSGSYIAWLNSDDRYLPGAVSAAVAELEAAPGAGFVYGGAEFIDRDGRLMFPAATVGPWDPDRLLRILNFIVQPATLLRREAYLTVGGLDLDLHYVMDYDLWIRLGERFPVAYTPRPLAQARAYGETKTSTGALQRMEEMERMIRSHGGRGLPKGQRREMWVALRDATAAAARERQWARAVRLAVRAAPYAARAASWKVRRTLRSGPARNA